jgi:hypothetical protein
VEVVVVSLDLRNRGMALVAPDAAPWQPLYLVKNLLKTRPLRVDPH